MCKRLKGECDKTKQAKEGDVMRVVIEGDLEEVVDGKRFPGLGN